MKAFKLSALALASAMVLAGCGGDSDGGNTGSNVPTQPPVDNSLSETQQAKSLINTAKQFIIDSDAIASAYENAGDILTSQQSDRVSATLDAPDELLWYMLENNVNTITAADIIAYNATVTDDDVRYGIHFNPSSDFVAMIDTDGTFKVSGTTEIIVYDVNVTYDGIEGYQFEELETDRFDATYNGLISTGDITETSLNTQYGFNSINIGEGSDAVMISSASQGIKTNFVVNDGVIVNDELNIGDETVELSRETITLGEVTIKANDSVVQAKNVSVVLMSLVKQINADEFYARTLPTMINLEGSYKKGSPETDVALTLNIAANENAIKNIVSLTNEGDFVEANNQFVDMTMLLSLKGNVSKQTDTTTKTIPLDIQANLSRVAQNTLELKGLSANVDGKNLFITGNSQFDANYDVMSTELTIKQNNATVVLKMDANGDFVKDSNGKIADIMVNGTDYGDLLENNGSVNAKFTDNSFVVLS